MTADKLMLAGAIILTNLRITAAVYAAFIVALIFFKGFGSVGISVIYLIAMIPLALPLIMIINHVLMRIKSNKQTSRS